MGDKIVVLNNGNVQQIDTANNIYNHPQNAFVATFMGTNPMNIIEATINKGLITFGNIAISLNTMPVSIQNKEKVLLGVRSEDIISEYDPAYPFNLIKFSADITFEENLGNSKNIYFKMGEKEFCASISSKTPDVKTMCFSINPASLHFFDIETGETLDNKIQF